MHNSLVQFDLTTDHQVIGAIGPYIFHFFCCRRTIILHQHNTRMAICAEAEEGKCIKLAFHHYIYIYMYGDFIIEIETTLTFALICCSCLRVSPCLHMLIL